MLIRLRSFGAYALILCGLRLSGQPLPTALKFQDQSLFLEDRSWVFLPFGPDPVFVKSPGKRQRSIPLSPEGKNFGYRTARNGCLYDVRRVPSLLDGRSEERIYLLRFTIEGDRKEQDWERIAEIDNSAGEPHLLVPLDKSDKYLGYGPFRGFYKDGKASPVAIFRKSGQSLKLDELVDLPYSGRSHIGSYKEEPVALPGGGQAKGVDGRPRIYKSCDVSPRSLNPNLLSPAILDGFLVLGSSKAGVLWVLSLQSGLCTRVVDIGGVGVDGLDKLGHVDHFLLGLQPDKQHRIVALTRSLDVLKFAQALDTPKGVSPEIRQANRSRFMETMQGFTDLHWWSVDPVTGAVEELNEPYLRPSRSISFAQQSLVRFLVGPEGRIYVNTHGSWPDVLEKLGVLSPASPNIKETERTSPSTPALPKSTKPRAKS